jgi:hypothetical protein
MAPNKMTLQDLFLKQAGETVTNHLKLLEQDDQVIAIKTGIEKIPDISWRHVYGGIQNEIAKILDIGFDDMLFGAWKKYCQLQQYRDTDKYPPDQAVPVPLVEHTITSTHRPYIDVFLNNRLIGRIVFAITLQLKLEGVVLKIQGGKICGVTAGACDGTGSLKIGDVSLIETKLFRFVLPDVITLAEGIDIPALERPQVYLPPELPPPKPQPAPMPAPLSSKERMPIGVAAVVYALAVLFILSQSKFGGWLINIVAYSVFYFTEAWLRQPLLALHGLFFPIIYAASGARLLLSRERGSLDLFVAGFSEAALIVLYTVLSTFVFHPNVSTALLAWAVVPAALAGAGWWLHRHPADRSVLPDR